MEMGRQELNLDLLAAQKIDKILLSKSPSAKALANQYWNIKHDGSIFVSLKGKTINEKLSNLFKTVERRLDKKTVAELKNDYPQEVIEEIYYALDYFERVLSAKPSVNIIEYSGDKGRAVKHLKQRHLRVVKAADTLIKEGTSMESEKKILGKIKERHSNHLNRLLQLNKVAIDSIKEMQLNWTIGSLPSNSRNCYRALYSPRVDYNEWLDACFRHLRNIVLTRARSCPKKVINNVLQIVIFNQLERKGTQTKNRYMLTAEIISQYTNKPICAKTVENAFHRNS